MQHVGSRLLAPAPSPPTQQGDSPGNSSSTLNQHVNTGIRRASTACQSCKQIKRKCDQAQPCSNCRKSNTRCVYNEAEDGRRKAARKRTVETLELKRDALDSILDSFRNSTDKHANQLLQLIRRNAPLEEVVQCATSQMGSLPRRQLDELVSQVDEQPRKSVMSVTALCDTPLFQLPAQPWTTVTTDDDLVSHLVSIFFTWYYPAYPTVDKDLFLRDMKAGSLDCRFCSPVLVNAMLALACNFSDHPLSCRIPSDGTTRGQHFLNEAIRLWAAEEGVPSLVNVQAASMLAVTSCLVGKDRISWSYIEQMNEMNSSLSLKHVRAHRWGLSPAPPESVHAEALASEAAFLLTVGYGIAFMKPSSKPLQLEASCHTEGVRTKTTWIPYPQQLPEVTFDFSQLREAFYEIHTIGLQIQSLLFGSSTDKEGLDVSILEDRLAAWLAALPEDLRIQPGPTTVKPPVVDLHLTYHFLCVTLFSFLITSPPRSVSEPAHVSPSSFSASTSIQIKAASKITRIPASLEGRATVPPPAGERKTILSEFQAKSLRSAKEIALLCQLYSRDFGLKQPSMWMPQAAASAAYSLIDLPISLSDPEVSESFHDLCSVLIAASKRWLVMKGHVRMLLVTADTKGQKLLPRTKRMLGFVAHDQWAEGDHKLFASSVYPNYTLAKDGADPRLNGMGDLLEIWADMNLDTEPLMNKEEAYDVNAEHVRLTSATTSRSDSTVSIPHHDVKG